MIAKPIRSSIILMIHVQYSNFSFFLLDQVDTFFEHMRACIPAPLLVLNQCHTSKIIHLNHQLLNLQFFSKFQALGKSYHFSFEAMTMANVN